MYSADTKLNGKTVVITGANTGIGKETALDLARRGARVILLCRNQIQSQAVVKEISDRTGSYVGFYHLDLSSMQSVRDCAALLNRNEPKIDILINNAGILAVPEWTTVDDIEIQFATNHLGHFLLTTLLLDKLKAAAPSRVITVASFGHRSGKMHWDDVNRKGHYDPLDSYYQSKLANILFTKELAKKVADHNITTYAVNPGFVHTSIFRSASNAYGKLLGNLFNWTAKLLFKTPVQGAQTTIYCAVDPALASSTGKYYANCKENQPTRSAKDEHSSERLWDLSVEMTRLPVSC